MSKCFVCIYVWVLCTCLVTTEAWNCSYRGLLAAMWDLVIKPGSPGRANIALDCWAITPDPEISTFKIVTQCYKLKMIDTFTFLLCTSSFLVTFVFVPQQWMPAVIMLNGYHLCSSRIPPHFPCSFFLLIMWHRDSLVKIITMFLPAV